MIRNVESPFGVFVSEAGIFVSSLDTNKILHFNIDGTFSKKLGTELKRPHNVILMDEKKIIVSNYGGFLTRIDFFNSIENKILDTPEIKGPVHVLKSVNNYGYLVTDFDGGSLFRTGHDFSILEELDLGLVRPHMAEVDELGYYYVVESSRGRLIKYDQNFNLVRESTEALKTPVSIHRDNDLLYVADVTQKQVRVFNLDLAIVKTIGLDEGLEMGSPYEAYPYGGKLYIADASKESVWILDLE